MASILAAFAVDAWWDRIQDRAEERVLLLNLRNEIEDAAAAIDEGLAAHTIAMCSAHAWLDITQTTPLDSVSRTIEGLFVHRTPALSLSTVSTVLASGELSLIQDDDLRRWVSEWPGVLADFDEELEGIVQYVRFVLPGYFTEAGIARAALAEERHPLFPRESIRQLVGHPGFQSLVQQGYFLNEVLVREGRLVKETLGQGAALTTGRAATVTAGAVLDDYVGEYEPSDVAVYPDLPSDFSLSLVVEDAGLVAVYPDDFREALLGGEERVFYLATNALPRLEFERAEGEVTGFSWSTICDSGGPSWRRVR